MYAAKGKPPPHENHALTTTASKDGSSDCTSRSLRKTGSPSLANPFSFVIEIEPTVYYEYASVILQEDQAHETETVA